MQISDLHRSEADPITNEELISCLLADRDRYLHENPSISPPEAILVSGDLVLGLPIGSSDYPNDLKRQYDEAFEFLVSLTDAFVNGDRSRVIIIPGNHDVDWNKARGSMNIVGTEGQNVRELLAIPNSPYRWSWESLSLFKIVAQDTYEDRFKYFSDMYIQFYRDARLSLPVDSKRPWNLFELDNGSIIICAFNSCVSNDCFNISGEILTKAIAGSHLYLINKRRFPSLRIALWHHDIQGSPTRSDYINLDTVRLMIDKGYRLGVHGHQHKSDTSPYSLHTAEKHIMSVVSVGSLCAGSRELPPGFNRQYNIIQIFDDYLKARVHVREMRMRGIFSPGRFESLDNKSYFDIEWTPAPPSYIVNTGLGGGPVVQFIEQIENLMKVHRFDEAIEQINSSQNQLGCYGRRLKTEALAESEKWKELIEHIREPENEDELTLFIRAAINSGSWDKGETVLKIAESSGQFSQPIIRELRSLFTIERRMKK